MSTRSIIIVTGREYNKDASTVRLYKHWDGYPTGNLPVILEALKKADEQDKEQRERFPDDDPQPHINVSQITGLIIGASCTIYGCGAHIDDGKARYDEAFNPKKHVGNQLDLEWVFVVNINKKNVDVYGNGHYTDAKTHMKNYETVHPDTEVADYKEEYKAPSLLELQEIYRDYKVAGWTINGTNLSTEAKPVPFRKIVLFREKEAV